MVLVLLDLSAAFDTLDHEIVYNRMSGLLLPGFARISLLGLNEGLSKRLDLNFCVCLWGATGISPRTDIFHHLSYAFVHNSRMI